MKPLRPIWIAGRWCALALGTFALWSLWLGLVALLGVQIYVASTNELELPGFVRRDLERRLEASGVRASFGRTQFDPSGRVLIEDVSLRLPGFPDPVITARAVYVLIDPWALLVNRFEPLELRATGVSLRIPAMFAPSGSADEGIRDLDAVLRPRGDELDLASLSFRLGNLAATATGTLHLGSFQAGQGPGLPLAEFLAHNYGAFSREFAGVAARLADLDQPVLRAELVPSETEGAVVHARLLARNFHLAAAGGLRVSQLRLDAAFPLLPRRPVGVEVSVDADTAQLTQPSATARGVHAVLFGRLAPGQLLPEVRSVELAAAGAAADGLAVEAPMVTADLGALPRLQVRVRGLLFSSPLAARIDGNLLTKAATVRFAGEISPGLVGWAGAKSGRDLRPFVALERPVRVSGRADFGAGWTFRTVSARVDARDVRAHGVLLDEARGLIRFDGRRLDAPEAYVRVGESVARGSYAGDLATRRYRFLLTGRLRPLEITPWFAKEWWPDFFGNFRFPSAPPAADIDLRGEWGDGLETAAFLSFDSAGPVIRDAAFDRIRGRIFVRPQFDDILDFSATRGAGTASGTFTRRTEPGSSILRRLDIDLTSTIDLRLARQVVGRRAAAILSPFDFGRPPHVRLQGRIDGPAAPGGPHEDLRIEASSDGPFRFHDFPFEGVAFTAAVHDDKIDVDPLTALFAGGRITGRAKVSGRGAGRRLSFDCSLAHASLARAVTAVEEFSARRRPAGAPQLSAFLPGRTDARIDLSAAAGGPYDDPLGLRGTGQATVRGSDLLQVKLLGLLSQLLNFTSLRFTTARAAFTLDGPEVTFPSVKVTGANSAIVGHGTYNVDRHALDFNVNIYPFREGKFLLPKIFDLATTPMSELGAVRLTGSLDKPSWAFVVGPTNILRSLFAPNPGAVKPAGSASHPAPAG